jgi:hypothetical protein
MAWKWFSIFLSIEIIICSDLFLVIGDDFISGYGIKEAGVSSRGLNFISGGDANSIYRQTSNLDSTRQRVNSLFFQTAPRGSRLSPRCDSSLQKNGDTYCPTLDILQLEEDDTSHALTDRLTVAIEGAGLDAIGYMLKILHRRYMKKCKTEAAPISKVKLFIFIGLRDICLKSCTDWALGEKFELRVDKVVKSIFEEKTWQHPVQVFMFKYPDLTHLYHYHRFFDNEKKSDEKRRCLHQLRQICPCLKSDEGRASMLQVTHDLNLRLKRLEKSSKHPFKVLETLWENWNLDFYGPEAILSDSDCFHWNQRGHQIFANLTLTELFPRNG